MNIKRRNVTKTIVGGILTLLAGCGGTSVNDDTHSDPRRKKDIEKDEPECVGGVIVNSRLIRENGAEKAAGTVAIYSGTSTEITVTAEFYNGVFETQLESVSKPITFDGKDAQAGQQTKEIKIAADSSTDNIDNARMRITDFGC